MIYIETKSILLNFLMKIHCWEEWDMCVRSNLHKYFTAFFLYVSGLAAVDFDSLFLSLSDLFLLSRIYLHFLLFLYRSGRFRAWWVSRLEHFLCCSFFLCYVLNSLVMQDTTYTLEIWNWIKRSLNFQDECKIFFSQIKNLNIFMGPQQSAARDSLCATHEDPISYQNLYKVSI